MLSTSITLSKHWLNSTSLLLIRALIAFRKDTDDGRELQLHQCEVASLMNLVATDTGVDEAKALIPSLSKFSDAAIDEILDLIKSILN